MLTGAGGQQFLGLDAAARPVPAAGAPVLLALMARGLSAAASDFAEERARWALWAPVAFGAGIWVYFSMPVEPAVAAALLPLIFAAVLRKLGGRGLVGSALTGILVLAGAGFAAGKLRTYSVAGPVLEKTLRAAVVEGTIERVEPRTPDGQRLTLRVHALSDLEKDKWPRRVRVRTRTTNGDLKPGVVVRIKAHLAPPSPPAMPGDYDFARQAWFEGLGGVGYAYVKPEVIGVATASTYAETWRQAIETLRQDIAARVKAALPGEPGAIATALITGDRGGISDQTTAAYRDSGLIHIMSISGLHMAIMAGAVFATLRLLMALVPVLVFYAPTKKIAAVFGIAAALGYLAISGAAPATERSAIMIVIMFIAVLLGRPAIALRNVALSALIILGLNPESLLDVGFQMSFAAVTALVAAYEAVNARDRQRPVRRALHATTLRFFGGILLSTVIAGLAVAPFSAYHFHKSQQFAALANLIVIPLCNIIVMPAALATLIAMPFGLEAGPLTLMAAGIDGMGRMAAWVAGLPGAVTMVPPIPEAAFRCVLAGSLWLVLWQRRWRLLGLPLIALGLALAPTARLPDALISASGHLVAVRTEAGVLQATAERPSAFELTRWLEHDGDARTGREAFKGQAFHCDGLGCMAGVKGLRLVISRHAAGLADDCKRADILILNRPRPSWCTHPRLTLDRPAILRDGSHAITIDASGTITVASVGALRGARPWSVRPAERQRPRLSERAGPTNRPVQRTAKLPETAAPPTTGRLAQFAAPAGLVAHFASPGPPAAEDDFAGDADFDQ